MSDMIPTTQPLSRAEPSRETAEGYPRCQPRSRDAGGDAGERVCASVRDLRTQKALPRSREGREDGKKKRTVLFSQAIELNHGLNVYH